MKIALALSGGGHRAAAFHLGVLKYLAEQNLLTHVSHISSTSGGSIVIAQVFHHSQIINPSNTSNASHTELTWPDSPTFLTRILHKGSILVKNVGLSGHVSSV